MRSQPIPTPNIHALINATYMCMLERGSIDIALTFDGGLIQLSFIPVCSPNTCNISVKLCRGFALQCFSLYMVGVKKSSLLLSILRCPFIKKTGGEQVLNGN